MIKQVNLTHCYVYEQVDWRENETEYAAILYSIHTCTLELFVILPVPVKFPRNSRLPKPCGFSKPFRYTWLFELIWTRSITDPCSIIPVVWQSIHDISVRTYCERRPATSSLIQLLANRGFAASSNIPRRICFGFTILEKLVVAAWIESNDLLPTVKCILVSCHSFTWACFHSVFVFNPLILHHLRWGERGEGN